MVQPMGRPRTSGNRDLPPNLYAERSGFRYVNPKTGKAHFWPVTRDRAIAAAKKCNSVLIEAAPDLVAGVLGGGKTMGDAIKLFQAEELPERDYATKTAAEAGFKLARLDKDFGDRQLTSFDVRAAAELLRAITSSRRNRQQYRTLLVGIFAGALEEGWIEFNPFRETRKPRYTKMRARLTIEGYAHVYNQARSWGWKWLLNAMDLTLEALFRGGDVTALSFADVRDGRLHVVPKKTADSTHVKLRIQMWPELQGIVERCRDNIVSPRLVHRLPEKARPQHLRAKQRTHHTEVLREQLTRAFEDARDACGFFAGESNPPTFHEIRSLGGDLHRQAGRAESWIQMLYAHSDREMTDHYLEGHEPPWTDIRLPAAKNAAENP